jgi:hypothetical protein
MSSKILNDPLHRNGPHGINRHISREPGFGPDDSMTTVNSKILKKANKAASKVASKALKARTKAIKKLGA